MADHVAAASDRWLALLAGRNTWQDAERGVDPSVRALSLLEASAITATVVAVLTVAAQNAEPGDPWFTSAAIILLAVTPPALVGPIRTAFGSVSDSRSAIVNILGRTALGILFSAAIAALSPSWWALISWPLGVAVGCDAALTATAIGWHPRPIEWWTSVFLSPFHLGVIGGLVGATLARSNAVMDDVLPLYAMVHLWLLIACCTAWMCQRVITVQRHLVEHTRAETVRAEHRRSAHWLHDDICAQLRLVTLRVQSGQVSMSEIGGLLDELDFALRLRQLDELIESGSVRLAEVLQPFLRNAQNFGVTVARVPSYDIASTEIDPETAIMFRRAAAVLTSNALNAGARTLWFDVEVRPSAVELTVTDDAGGFDPSDITAGRGLWSLRHDLGADHLSIARVDGGSSVTAVVPHQQLEQAWPT
jgi:hypothetical protein